MREQPRNPRPKGVKEVDKKTNRVSDMYKENAAKPVPVKKGAKPPECAACGTKESVRPREKAHNQIMCNSCYKELIL